MKGRGTSPGEVHDIALKAAETDATKRALATFGKPWGLSSFGKAVQLCLTRPPASASCRTAHSVWISPRRYDTYSTALPLLRPPTIATNHRPLQGACANPHPAPSAAPPLAPALPAPSSAKIDKSVLMLAEPKRRRDKSHLRFVASQPCLVCARHPSDPHHLRFAQPRALGLKVSDEFTVPLCRGHHRQLHQAGNEINWWTALKIDALPVARQLWEQTHPNECQTETQAQRYWTKRSKDRQLMATEKQIAANRQNRPDEGRRQRTGSLTTKTSHCSVPDRVDGHYGHLLSPSNKLTT